MTVAGHSVVVKAGGTSTAFTGAATTSLGGNVYQLSDATKRVLDPDVAVAVYDAGTPLAATAFTVDYLFGKVTLNGAPGGAVTVDGAFIPLLSVAGARGITINMGSDELDAGTFGVQHKALVLGKAQADGDLSYLEPLDADLDPGGSTTSWRASHRAGTPLFLEAAIDQELFRAWVKLPSLQTDSPQDGLLAHTIPWKSINRRPTGRTEEVAFDFG